MIKKRSVLYNERVINYEVDDSGLIWILNKGHKVNVGQQKPIENLEDIDAIVLEMLDRSGIII